MYLPEIDYFLAIADCGSINRAANRLFLSPSALSQFLTKLEKRLNIALFIRGKDSLQLTEAGYIYYYSAKQIQHIKDETMERLQSFTTNAPFTIRIATSGVRSLSFVSFLWPILRKSYPECYFSLSNLESTRIYEQIESGALDFGIVALDDEKKDTFQYTRLHHEELCLVFSENLPINEALYHAGISPDAPAPLSLFKDEAFIMLPKGSILHRLSMKYMHQESFTPKAVTPSIQSTISDVVRITSAVGFSSYGYRTTNSSGLVFQRLQNPLFYDLGLICRKDHVLTDLEKSFIALAVESKEHY